MMTEVTEENVNPMDGVIDKLVEAIPVTKKDPLKKLLRKTVRLSKDSTVSTYSIYPNILFLSVEFLKGLTPLLQEFGKNNEYTEASKAFCLICEELGIDIEKEEAFILYHMRNLGKFRTREEDLYKEMIKKWQVYNDFKLDQVDFAHAMKGLMRLDLVHYRRRNISLNTQIIIRYRTEKYKNN